MITKLKYFLPIFLFVLSFGLARLASPVWAAVLQLTSIGNGIISSQTFTNYSYTGENPVFVGKATASAQVDIALNSTSNSVTANTLGDWTFTPTTLLVGTHSVVITSGSESKSFTLTIASTSAAATPSATPTLNSSASAGVGGATTLPESGGVGINLVIYVLGMGAVGLGLMSWSLIQSDLAKSETEKGGE